MTNFCCPDNCCMDCFLTNEEFMSVTDVSEVTVVSEEVVICPICKEPNTSHMDNWICG